MAEKTEEKEGLSPASTFFKEYRGVFTRYKSEMKKVVSEPEQSSYQQHALVWCAISSYSAPW